MSDNFTRQAIYILQEAIYQSYRMQQSVVSSPHLAFAATKENSSYFTNILKKAGVYLEQFRYQTMQYMYKYPQCSPIPDHPSHTSYFERVIYAAQRKREELKDKFLGAPHIAWGLLADYDVYTAISQSGATVYAVYYILEKKYGKVDTDDAENRADALEKYCTELVSKAEAGKLDYCIGRDAEIRRLTEILSRRTKNNPVLTGAAGVGKTQIVEGLAHRVVRGDVPANLQDVKIFSLDLGSMLAGAKYRGEFEERLKGVIDEVKESEGTYILFIDELHTLLGAGGSEGTADAANLLKPALARGEIRCIGATTTAEYRKFITKDRAFERRFAEISVEEPGVEDTISILRGIAEKYQNHHQVRITDGALVAAAKLADRYIRATGRKNPDAAIDLLDEACASVRVSLDSYPEVIDYMQRRKTRLLIEIEALDREIAGFPENYQLYVRKTDLQYELNQVEAEIKPLEAQYCYERYLIDRLSSLKEKLRSYTERLELHELRKEVQKAADIKYGVIPEIKDQIAKCEEQVRRKGDAQALLKAVVTEEEIAAVVSKWTGIPVTKLTYSDREKIMRLSETLQKRVIGQDYAVYVVADSILRSRANLKAAHQPIGSFLFLGSSGCGKTHLAKTLALELFDSEQNLVRIDMSEYTEEFSVSRLIGAPPGYVGYDQAGQLTEAVAKRRYAVVLFDEIEKAHPKILTLLLQILDDGRLTDGQGNTVDFTSTVVMLTSNLGSAQLIDGYLAGRPREAQLAVMETVKRALPPELVNRFDDIVVFNPLMRADMARIFDTLLDDLRTRVLTETKHHLVVSPRLLDLALQDCDLVYGARPLRRYIEREITTIVAKLVLSGYERVTVGSLTARADAEHIYVETV